MRLPILVLLLTVLAASCLAAEERADWAAFFEAFEAEGTIVVVDQRRDRNTTWVHASERAGQRFSPASTFKIPHTLFALDAGVLRDEFQRFAWDGTEHAFDGHNRDQDLRSAMRVSAVWVYRQFARAIGEERAQAYLESIGYGNAEASMEQGDYWLADGPLAISAHEQIDFLERLYRNQLPFQIAHQRLVKDVIIVEAGRDWILRAKTGWTGRLGWWVGWVEWPDGPVFFALNIDTPNRMADLVKREQIARAVLQSINALPARAE
ncbi:MAG: class D beta-lactamase [Wenzhouxiangella sp.]